MSPTRSPAPRSLPGRGPSLRILLALAGFATLLGGTTPGAHAGKKAAERYHMEITGSEVAEGLPATLGPLARARLTKLLSTRKEFVASIDGAPSPEDAVAHAAWLRKHGLRAFRVVIKLSEFEKSVARKEEGRPSMVVKVKTALSLLATGTDGALAISGDGGATIGVEVGAKVRPRDEELATQDSVDAALAAAIDDTVAKLRAPPPAKPAKR